MFPKKTREPKMAGKNLGNLGYFLFLKVPKFLNFPSEKGRFECLLRSNPSACSVKRVIRHAINYVKFVLDSTLLAFFILCFKIWNCYIRHIMCHYQTQ